MRARSTQSIKHCIEFAYLLLQMHLLLNFLLFVYFLSLLLITSCNLSPKFLLILHDSSVLQSIITFNAKSLRKNLLFGCFSACFIHICTFCILDHICLWWLVNFYDLIFLLYAFHLTVTYQYHLLLLLCHFFICLLLMSTILYIHTKNINLFDFVKFQ